MENIMRDFGVTQNKLAVPIGVAPCEINEIVRGQRGIAADTAIRLARFFGASERFWMNLQSNCELCLDHRMLREPIAVIEPLSQPASAILQSTPEGARSSMGH